VVKERYRGGSAESEENVVGKKKTGYGQTTRRRSSEGQKEGVTRGVCRAKTDEEGGGKIFPKVLLRKGTGDRVFAEG